MKEILYISVLILIIGCNNDKSIIDSEKVIQRLLHKNASANYLKCEQDEFIPQNVCSIMKEAMNELNSFGEVIHAKERLILYADSLELKYQPNRFDEEYDRHKNYIFELNKQLKRKQLNKIEEYDAIDKIMDFILYEERYGILVCNHPKIKLYFNDTIYLARNQIYKFPIALYRDYHGEGKIMNVLTGDLNFEEKFISINTNNVNTNVFKKEILFKHYNQFGEIYNLRDSITIKIVD